MSGPLSGIKVIEIAGIGPGPFAAMMLADMGADVIRVDRAQRPCGGDPATPAVDVLNRGRRSIGVDLKHARRRRDGARARRAGRRADRGLPPGRHRAARPRPRRVPGPQPEARLRPHDRLGPGRPVCAQAAGHDINYIALAGALAHIGRAGEKPDAAAQPGRRLRRRRHAARLRRRVRAASRRGRSGQGQVSTRRWSTAPRCS